MSRIDKYADWLVDNQDKKGTPDFETVVNAYKELRAQESDTLVDDVFKLQEVPEDAPIETDFLDEIEEGIKGIGGGAVNILESAALGAITPFGEDTESYLREGIQSVGGAAKSLFEADKGSEDLVGRKFGEALEVCPRTLGENGGQDYAELLSALYSAHAAGNQNMGVDIENDGVIDCLKHGIFDPFAVKENALVMASDAVITVLRVDQIIMSKQAGGPKKQ